MTGSPAVAGLDPVPVELSPFRAGTVWHCRRYGYLVLAVTLSELAKDDAVYQLDGAAVSARVRADGPTVLELTLGRAPWADTLPVVHAFDEWLHGCLWLTSHLGQAWRVMTGEPHFDGAAIDARTAQPPSTWTFRLYRSPGDDQPPGLGQVRDIRRAFKEAMEVGP